jgi:hypothetical protein
MSDPHREAWYWAGNAAKSIHRDCANIQDSSNILKSATPLKGETMASHVNSSPEAATPLKVFVSWAHSHSSWKAEQTKDWEQQVVTFTTALRQSGGLEADVHLYHTADQTIDWTRYGPSCVETFPFTVVVMSVAWAERWSGKNKHWEGAGAAAEADAIHGLFTRHQVEWQKRLKIALFPGVPRSTIPLELERVPRFKIDPFDFDTYEDLVRTLTSQPTYVAPPVTRVPVLPPAVLKAAERTETGRLRRGKNERELLVAELREIEARISSINKDVETHENRRLLERLNQQLVVNQGVLDALSLGD